ncbi:hypothetical protein ABW21_db0204189 [Orbilia brochopaga]|nr:hypothetical protein ABW21_db0204189 [Drechslerella brochopaga]
MVGRRRFSTSLLLACCTTLQLLQPVRAIFWLRATTLWGEFDLDEDSFLTAAQISKPITLTTWRECVSYNYLWHVAALGNNQAQWSFCSFSADFIDGYWSIRSTADPQMLDTWNRDLYTDINDPTRRPRIEFAELWDAEWQSYFQYLTMGTAAKDSGDRVRWTAYRPANAVANEGTGRRSDLLADGRNPTFENLHRLGNAVDLSLSESGGIPLQVNGGSEGHEINRFPGDFPVIEVKGRSEADLEHGDFLVLRGGGLHLQVCFQEMTTRGNDGQFVPAIKPSFIEYYGDLQPPPLNRAGVVGCKEIVLRVYKNIDTRIEPILPNPTEESHLIQELAGTLSPETVNPQIEINAQEGFSESPYGSEPGVIDRTLNAQAGSVRPQDSPYMYNREENDVKLEEEVVQQGIVEEPAVNRPAYSNLYRDNNSPRMGMQDTVPRFLPDLREQTLFFGQNKNGPNSEVDSLEELLRSDSQDEVLEIIRDRDSNFQEEQWPWQEAPIKIEEGEEDQNLDAYNPQPLGTGWFNNPFSRANRGSNTFGMTDEYQPPLGQRGQFGYSDNAMSGEQQSQLLSGFNSRFSSPDVISGRQQQGQMMGEYDTWSVPMEEPLYGLSQRDMATIQRLLYEQAQQRASETQPN